MYLIENYGITLTQLTHDKIEMVRRWRNDPKIQQYMEYREEITPEMQEKWFKKISSDNTNLYFVLSVDGKDIGLMNIKDIDYDKKTGETGVFIWDDDYLNHDYGVRGGLCIHDFAFNELGLESLHGHTLENNKRANRMNKFLGYKMLPDQDGVENKAFWLNKADYFAKTEKVKKLLRKINNK